MPLDSARQLSSRNFGELRDAIRVIRRIEGCRGRLALAAIGICLVSLAGHLLDPRALYLPLPDGGGTHPLTAVTAILLAAARLVRRRPAEIAFAALALALLGLRAIEIALPETGLSVSRWIGGAVTPALRLQVETGPATLIALAAVAASILLWRRSTLGMAALAAAAGICGTVIVAYSYAMEMALGGMSPVTTSITLLLVLATVARHLDPLALRLLLSEGPVSRMLRRQLVLALSGLWIGGLLLLQLRAEQWAAGAPLFVAVMLVLAATGLMSSVSMLAQAENQRQRQQAELERLSVTDALTGLANRWACDLFGSRALAAARRHGTGLSVVLIDVDRFKHVNDRHGHAAGDRVLREVGHLLPRWMRRSDLAARWGGEEFLLILDSTRLTGAMTLAERVRRCFEEKLSLPDGSGPITASFGCAELLPGDETIEAVINRADAALYRAKTGGRNRVEPPLPPDPEGPARPGSAAATSPRRARRAADAA